MNKTWKYMQMEYAREVEDSGFCSGDKVRVVRKTPSLKDGWSAFWSDLFMTPRIGKTGIIVSLEGCAGVRVEFEDGEAFNFPYQSLEKA